MTRLDRIVGALAMVAVAAAIGAVVLAVGYTGRGELVESERRQCWLQIEDRLDTIEVRKIQASAAHSIANDPFQSVKTRRVLKETARRLDHSVARLTISVDPKHGGTLICSEVFPKPSLRLAL